MGSSSLSEGNGFVARAGTAALLRVGSFERREVLRRLLIEAQEGQALRPQRPAPGPPEPDPAEGDGPGAEDEEPGEEDHEFELDVEEPEEIEGDDLPAGALVYALGDRSALAETLVGANVARWLHACPAGPLIHPSEAAWRAVKALACGWAATIVHALAGGPRALAELETAVAGDLGRERLTGVTARFESGRVASVAPGLDERADAWAVGSAGDWLDAVVEPDEARVRTGGERSLAETAIPGLHGVLFAGAPYKEPDRREPADRGAELRRQVAAADPDTHRAYAGVTLDEVADLRQAIEARGAAPVEDEMEITFAYQVHIWEEDLGMLFRVAEGEPLADRLADELIALWTAWQDASDPDEPFI